MRDVDGATGSRGHVNPAFPRVTTRTPIPIITQRSVNTRPREAVTSRSKGARATTVARQSVNTALSNRRAVQLLFLGERLTRHQATVEAMWVFHCPTECL
jgi:hypothetical protein